MKRDTEISSIPACKSILVFQMLHHKNYPQALQSVRDMDFSDYKVNIIHALYDKIEKSTLYNREKHLCETDTRRRAQLEKYEWSKKLCSDNDYDYVLYIADDVIVREDTLVKLVESGKDCISALITCSKYGKPFYYAAIKNGEYLRPETFKSKGNIIEVDNIFSLCLLLSREIVVNSKFKGFIECDSKYNLDKIVKHLYIHTGTDVQYLPVRN